MPHEENDKRRFASVLVAGCGYVGGELIGSLVSTSVKVAGLTRREETAREASRSLGVQIDAVDIGDANVLTEYAAHQELPRPLAIVHCASSGRRGPEIYRDVFVEGVNNLAKVFEPDILLFTSSTSVYGQIGGENVSEKSDTTPDAETSKILLEAESHVIAGDGIVARLAGLYGPGRCVYLDKVRDGTASIGADTDRFTNQLHRDDAVSAIVHLLEHGARGEIYNVVDDQPALLSEVYRIIARRTGHPVPERAPGDVAEPIPRKRALTNKRVSNAKLRAMGWRPRYSGIADALVAGAV
jgi:nucleoside-diphosphate-sugar epimerase